MVQRGIIYLLFSLLSYFCISIFFYIQKTRINYIKTISNTFLYSAITMSQQMPNKDSRHSAGVAPSVYRTSILLRNMVEEKYLDTFKQFDSRFMKRPGQFSSVENGPTYKTIISTKPDMSLLLWIVKSHKQQNLMSLECILYRN